MAVFIETCDYCKGRGVAERFEQRVRDEWIPTTRAAFDGMPEWSRADFQAQCIAQHPSIFRWSGCRCPKCDGAGEYAIESVPCRIF